MAKEMVTIARGKTFPVKDILKGFGFRPLRHKEGFWWYCDPALTLDELQSLKSQLRREGGEASLDVEIKDIAKNYLPQEA